MHTIEVLWTGDSAVYAETEKVTPFQPTRVTWQYFRKRKGMVIQMCPVQTFLHELRERPRFFAAKMLRFARREARADETFNAVIDALENAHDDEIISFFENYVAQRQRIEGVGLENKTNSELQDMLRDRGLPIYGAKADLIERLESN